MLKPSGLAPLPSNGPTVLTPGSISLTVIFCPIVVTEMLVPPTILTGPVAPLTLVTVAPWKNTGYLA